MFYFILVFLNFSFSFYSIRLHYFFILLYFIVIRCIAIAILLIATDVTVMWSVHLFICLSVCHTIALY